MSDERARTLEHLRKEIQDVDAAVIELLARRMRIVRAIGDVKRSQGIAVVDPAREAAVVSYVAQLARDSGLPEDDVRELFWRIMALSRREQHAE